MKSIVLREIKSFFGSPIGYLVIALFLIGNGLFLWVFEGDYNVLNTGFADLTPFFTLAPWILIFLIPAVTMRSFSDEKKQGTLREKQGCYFDIQKRICQKKQRSNCKKKQGI